MLEFILLLILGLVIYQYVKRQKDQGVNQNQQTKVDKAEPVKQETTQDGVPPENEDAQDAETLKQEQAPVESVEQPKPIEKPKEETVPVTFSDGTTKEYNLNLTLNDTDVCLLAEGGETYHTHVNCFKNWPAEYQENFTGWKATTIDEAEKTGYRRCKYCKDADRTEWDDYKNKKPLKTFTVTHKDEYAFAGQYNVGSEVTTDYDFEKDKDTLEIDFEEICYMPKSARDFFDENVGNYKMFVLDAYENDLGKVKLKIGIFEE